MKLRHAIISLLLATAAGCDRMEQDVDGKMLSINNDAVYFLNSGGFIDLQSRIIAPGKVRVEITTSTSQGNLKDIGQGLLHYAPFKGSRNDFFKFRVFNDNNTVLADDSIGIVIPTDTTQLPCTQVYAVNDSVFNITGLTFIQVTGNDYACGLPIHITRETDPQHGTAGVWDNGSFRYEPDETFTGTDSFMYRAIVNGDLTTASYGMVYITKNSSGNPGCTPLAADDLFYKTIGDTTTSSYDILANDTLCDSAVDVTITQGTRGGFSSYDRASKMILYRAVAPNRDDTLRYMVCGPSGCASAQAIIKRN